VRLSKSVERCLRWVVEGLCTYEAVALQVKSNKMPTISRLCGRHKWMAPIILGGLGVHLYWRELGGQPTERD